MKDSLQFENIFTQSIRADWLQKNDARFDVLRLDRLHEVVSGNKWFKLKYWLLDAAERNYTTIATFGGAFSNHILATAYACYKQNLICTGFIRGEEPQHYSQTLLDAKALNMQLKFISRADYSDKQNIIQKNASLFFIPEGGYGKAGACGAAEILQFVPDTSIYNYIICAVGTGTMLAGIANASLQHQRCIGISVMKNNFSLIDEVFALVNNELKNRAEILHDYHFGGYAKHTQPLIDFMNEIWKKFQLPLDFVYTAKALYAVYHLTEKNYFQPASKILFIHSGGLQGNRSLKEKALLYS